MKKEISVSSKAQVLPGKGRIVCSIVLSVMGLLSAVIALAQFFGGRHDAAQLLTGAIIGMMLVGFARSPQMQVHYESYIADIDFFADRLTIGYRQKNIKMKQPGTLQLPDNRLESAEYSDRLECFRLKFRGTLPEASNPDYHLLYVLDGQEDMIAELLEERTGLKVMYMDRPAEN